MKNKKKILITYNVLEMLSEKKIFDQNIEEEIEKIKFYFNNENDNQIEQLFSDLLQCIKQEKENEKQPQIPIINKEKINLINKNSTLNLGDGYENNININ